MTHNNLTHRTEKLNEPSYMHHVGLDAWTICKQHVEQGSQATKDMKELLKLQYIK